MKISQMAPTARQMAAEDLVFSPRPLAMALLGYSEQWVEAVDVRGEISADPEERFAF